MWQQPNQYSWYIGGTSYRQICWTQLKELSFARSLSMSRWPDGYGLEKQKWQIWLSAFDLVDSTSKWTNCDKLQSIRTDLWRKRTNLWKKRTNLWRKKQTCEKRDTIVQKRHSFEEKGQTCEEGVTIVQKRTGLWRKGQTWKEKGQTCEERDILV